MGCIVLFGKVLFISNPCSNYSFIPAEWRPDISVRVLPAVESILYGANLSNILSKHTSPFFDVLAWLPYGIIHFGAPVVCSGVLFLFAPPGSLPVFARSFGYMSLTGVIIQLIFPCSPPCTSYFRDITNIRVRKCVWTRSSRLYHERLPWWIISN